MNNNASIDTQVQGAPLSVAVTPQHLAVPDGWKLVPVEPTPEIIAGAAIASWPTATLADIDLARQAAPLVLMQMDMAPGTTVDALAGMLATMAPAYRAMLAATPKYSPLPAAAPQVVADERKKQDGIEAAELQTLLISEFECYRPTHPAGLMAWARIALLDCSPHRADPAYAIGRAAAPVQAQEPNRELMQLLGMVENDDIHDIMAMAAMRIKRLQAAPVQPVAAPDDAAKLKHERDTLAQGIADAALKAGIWNGEVPLSGPHLLMMVNDMAECIAAPAAQGDAKDACAEMRALCSSCGGTGDVRRADGEWLGECTCIHGQAHRREQQAHGAHPAPCARSCEAPAFQSLVRERDASIAQLEAQLVRRRTPLSPETQQAIAAARAAGQTIAATPAGMVFMNDGAEPGSGELDCPTCGGSGHAADVAARSTP